MIVNPNDLPAIDLEGVDRWSYRLVGVEDLSFGTFPSYDQGGPSLVTRGGWGVSYESLDRLFSSPSVVVADDGLVTLKVYQYTSATARTAIHHELHGSKYATRELASQAAYEAGCLSFMVYDRDAHKYPALVELLAKQGVQV